MISSLAFVEFMLNQISTGGSLINFGLFSFHYNSKLTSGLIHQLSYFEYLYLGMRVESFSMLLFPKILGVSSIRNIEYLHILDLFFKIFSIFFRKISNISIIRETTKDIIGKIY